jgi:hypothetical protein
MRRLSIVCGAPLLLGVGGVDDPSPAPAPAPEIWYRPSAAESQPPQGVRYAPIGVLVEPQLAVHNLRGGTLTSVLATVPVNPYVGFVFGGVFADTARVSVGLDFLRYAGLELPIVRGAASVSLIAAPTVGAASIFAGGLVAGDAWTAPLGLRVLVERARSMAELRLSGHLLFGGEVGLDRNAKEPGTAETLGLQLVVAPLFIKTRAGVTREAER